MPITLAQADYSALFDEMESGQSSGSDLDDVTWKYPTALGQGFDRSIQLRDGLELAIAHYQLRDDLILQLPARPHPLEYSLLLSGHCRNQEQSVQAGQYLLCSSGLAPREQWEILATQPVIEVNVHIEPERFCEFIGYPLDTITRTVQKLVGNPEQEYLGWTGMATAPLQMVAQQILHCPYQGLTQRMYLESKVWELMALLIEQISEPQQSACASPLKADDIERIHHAKNILLQQMEQPPSLLELARQVGLNDCTLKRGFRQVFGTTAFGYLHRYRLEQARRLLETEDLNIAEVAQRVGFADRSYFTAAFRKQFGCNPGVYRRAQRTRVKPNIPLTPQKNSA